MGDGFVVVLLGNTLALSAKLILAAMGGYTGERVGIINIGLEGMMLGSACATALVASRSGNPALGVAAGIAVAVLLSLTHALLTQAYRVDQIVSGMAINLLALGGTNVADRLNTERGGDMAMPWTPLMPFYIAAFVLPALLAWATARTRMGLRAVAVGADPDKARQMGVIPERVRYFGQSLTGAFCGLAGALIASNAQGFVNNMTAGAGYIALAALILGGWRPIPAMVAALLFGFFDALQIQLQGTDVLGVQVPYQVWSALPYAITVVALAGFLTRTRPPAGLGAP